MVLTDIHIGIRLLNLYKDEYIDIFKNYIKIKTNKNLDDDTNLLLINFVSFYKNSIKAHKEIHGTSQLYSHAKLLVSILQSITHKIILTNKCFFFCIYI